MRLHPFTLLSVAYLIVAVSAPTFGQQAPSLGYIFPPVVRSGATTPVQLGGYDFTADMQFFVHDEQLKLTATGGELSEFFVPTPPFWFGEKGFASALPIPREIPANIEVPAKQAPRLVHWQVANANGSAGTGVLAITETPQTLENRHRDEPQQLPQLPIGVSGRLSKIAEVDRYQFVARKTGTVTVSLMARRLGVDLNAVIRVHDAEETLLVDTADTLGQDTTVTFPVIAKQRYTLALHDVDFRGHRSMVYNVAIVPGPRVLATMPTQIPGGRTTQVTFVGYGLTNDSAGLTRVTKPVKAPSGEQMVYSLVTPQGKLAVPLQLTDRPVVTTPLASGLLPIPCDITAPMPETAIREFRFVAAQGQAWTISAQSLALGTGMDLALAIINSSGERIASNDDLSTSSDPRLEFKVPADGEYICRVSDVSGSALNIASIFQLSIALQQPDFSLSIPLSIQAPLGGQATVPVKAVRLGGFDGAISLSVSGLPAGVTLGENPHIPAGKPAGNLVLQVAEDATVVAASLRITGQGQLDETTFLRVAHAPATGNLCPRTSDEQRIDQSLLAMTMKPPFRVELIDKNRQRTVHRGTTYPAPFVITRDPEFTGAVRLQMAAKQSRHRQGIRGPIITVPANAERVFYPCFMPEWLATDRTSRMVVLGVAEVADPSGKRRQVTVPADARVTMILEGALLKLAHSAHELAVAPGSSFEVPVQLSRSAKFPAAVTVELVPPVKLTELLHCPPLDLAANEAHGTLKIQTTQDERLRGQWPLTLRATAMQDGQWPVISQTEVLVEFSDTTAKPKVAAKQ